MAVQADKRIDAKRAVHLGPPFDEPDVAYSGIDPKARLS